MKQQCELQNSNPAKKSANQLSPFTPNIILISNDFLCLGLAYLVLTCFGIFITIGNPVLLANRHLICFNTSLARAAIMIMMAHLFSFAHYIALAFPRYLFHLSLCSWSLSVQRDSNHCLHGHSFIIYKIILRVKISIDIVI